MLWSGQLFNDGFWTLARVTAGFSIGTFAGVFLGRITGLHPSIRIVLNATIQALRPIPAVALIPVVIVLFGIGELAKVMIVAWACFFPVWIATHSAVQRVPRSLLWTAQTLGMPYSSVVRRVIVPWATPFILAGVRTGLGLSFAAVVVAEMSGAGEGLGYRIIESQLVFRYDQMLASIIAIGVTGLLIDVLFRIVVRFKYPWLGLRGVL
jgi:ABC-type nitrate/sulfonate/bicarbonate transport system permease component